MVAKLLIVEDHEDFRQVLIRHLESQDLELKIVEAEDGGTAISTAREQRPDIILMDIRLPDQSGLDAANEIKKFLPESEIVVLTMFETDAFRKVFRSDDITEYLGKSELYDKLVPVLRRILAKNKVLSKTATNRVAKLVEKPS